MKLTAKKQQHKYRFHLYGGFKQIPQFKSTFIFSPHLSKGPFSRLNHLTLNIRTPPPPPLLRLSLFTRYSVNS